MNLANEGPSQVVSRGLLVILRVYLGVIFLVAVWPKLSADPSFAPRLTAFLERFAMESAHGFYKDFLQAVVLPYAGLFAGLVIAGELVTGLALVTGTATRLAAGVAVFLTLNYLFAKGNWFWTPSSNDAAFIFIGLVLLLGRAGRTLGVDSYLGRKWPKSLFW